MNRNKQIFRLPPLPAVFLSAALFGAACAGATAAPGLLAEYFDFIDTPLTDFPDLSGLVPDAVLVEPQIWHPSTSGAWDGLEATRFTDRFAARYSGFLDVPTNGTYTFALSSDDGSRLWIDGVLVVNHGGVHGMGRKAGAATLAAGSHELLLLYFENGGGAGLTLSWSGPGFGEEAVPASALSHDPFGVTFRPYVKMLMRTGAGFARAGLPSPLECAAWDGDAPAAAVSYLVDGVQLDAPPATNAPFTTEWTPPATGTHSVAAVALSADGLCATSAPVSVTALVPPDGMGWGLDAEYFDFRGLAYSDTPDLRGCAPAVTRTEDTVLFPQTHLAWDGLPGWMTDDFAARITGWLAVREAGEYTLILASDDASRLWIDGECLIDNGGIHQWRERSAAVALAAGLHRIRIEYFERAQASGVVLYWKTPERLRGPVPPSCLLRDLDVSADSDADGMPDAWETAWGLDPDDPSDAAGDADGDGIPNLSEFTAGTPPLGFTLPPAASAPGVRAAVFPLGDSDPDAIPELDGLVPALVRADASVDFPRSPGIRAGLPADLFPGAFAARLTGFLRVPATGWYSFRLRSDDGSRLTLGGTVAIDHDGIHNGWDRTVRLRLASGDTPLLLEYFDAGAHSELTLSWSGPGFAERPVSGADLVRRTGASAPVVSVAVPADGAVYGEGNTVPLAAAAASLDGEVATVSLLLDGAPAAAAPGGEISAAWTNAAAGEHLVSAAAFDSFGNCRTSLSVRVTVEPTPPGYAFGAESRFFPFPTNLAAIPATDGLSPDLSRTDDALDFPETDGAWEGLPAAMADRFASVHAGCLWVRESGDYTLALRSDDGSRLTLGGEVVIDHGGCHSMSRKSATLRLLAGCHPFRLEYFENTGRSGLSLLWSGAGFAERAVEPTALLRPAGNPDADGDGMPDWWESMHGLDPLAPAAPGLDTDGDGIPDLVEFLETGTIPESPDTDGDGMPDGWEADNGTDPLVWDRLDDPDGDGLCNFDEFLAGTAPLDPDTDGDGLSDGDEVFSSRTNPIAPDFAGRAFLQAGDAAAGASASSRTGAWGTDGDSIYARERSCSAAWTLDVPSPPPDALGMTAVQRNALTDADGFDLSLYVDGLFAARVYLRAPYGSPGEAVFFLPPLEAGPHEFLVRWRNRAANTFPQFDSLRFLRVSGGSGDWSENRAANVSGVSDLPETSLVSPLCVEGRDLWRDVLEIRSDYPEAGSAFAAVPTVGDGFYADVPLDPSGAPVTVSLDDGGTLNHSFGVAWEPFDVFTGEWATNPVTVRAGSSLRLAGPGGAETSFTVSRASGGEWRPVTNLTASAPVPYAFAGDALWLVGAECAAGGTQAVAFAQVRSVASSFPARNPAAVARSRRLWHCPALSPDADLEHDAALLLSATESPTGAVLSATAPFAGGYGMVTRLPDGPVLDAARLTAFWADNGGYYRVVHTYPDGTQLAEVSLLLASVPEGLEVRLEIFVSGVAFEDGTRVKTLSASDFDADGVCRVRFLRSAGVTTSVCHRTYFYQGGARLR